MQTVKYFAVLRSGVPAQWVPLGSARPPPSGGRFRAVPDGRALPLSSSTAKFFLASILSLACVFADPLNADDVYSDSDGEWTVVGQKLEQYCSAYRDVRYESGQTGRLTLNRLPAIELLSVVVSALREFERLEKTYGDNHPLVIRMRDRVARLRKGTEHEKQIALTHPSLVWISRVRGAVTFEDQVIGTVAAEPSETGLVLTLNISFIEFALVESADQTARMFFEIPWKRDQLGIAPIDFRTARRLLQSCADEVLK